MQPTNLIMQLMAVTAIVWLTAAAVRDYQIYGWLWPLYRLGALGLALQRWAVTLTRWAVTTKYASRAWLNLLQADMAKEKRAAWDSTGRYYVSWSEITLQFRERNNEIEAETAIEAEKAAEKEKGK